MEEKNDWNRKVDNKADHSDDIAIFTKLFTQSVGVVYIATSCIYYKQAGIERENEGDESQNDAKYNSTLLKCPWDDCESCSRHTVPSTEDCHEGAMFALSIHYIKKANRVSK